MVSAFRRTCLGPAEAGRHGRRDFRRSPDLPAPRLAGLESRATCSWNRRY